MQLTNWGFRSRVIGHVVEEFGYILERWHAFTLENPFLVTDIAGECRFVGDLPHQHGFPGFVARHRLVDVPVQPLPPARSWVRDQFALVFIAANQAFARYQLGVGKRVCGKGPDDTDVVLVAELE